MLPSDIVYIKKGRIITKWGSGLFGGVVLMLFYYNFLYAYRSFACNLHEGNTAIVAGLDGNGSSITQIDGLFYDIHKIFIFFPLKIVQR
jgi:hypothetical protein